MMKGLIIGAVMATLACSAYTHYKLGEYRAIVSNYQLQDEACIECGTDQCMEETWESIRQANPQFNMPSVDCLEFDECE